MAAPNTSPIYSRVGDIQWGLLVATTGSNTALDGTGTLGATVFSIFTADATNGGRIDGAHCWPLGNNGNGAKINIFINNGSTNATPANNSRIAQLTAAPSQLTEIAFPVGLFPLVLPPGYRILATYDTSSNGFGWMMTMLAGKY